MIMQLLSAIFLALCISTEFSSVILGIVIYNILLTIFKKSYLKKYKVIVNVYNSILFYTVFLTEIILLFYGNNIINIFTNLLLILNCYFNYLENKNYTNIITLLIQFLVVVITILCSVKEILSIEIRETILFIIVITMYIQGIIIENKKWRESLVLVSSITIVALLLVVVLVETQPTIAPMPC